MPSIQDFLRASPLPHLETQMLLQHALGLSRIGLISHAHDPMDAADLTQLNHLVNRRVSGEPMAYIVGQREFYGRMFRVTPDVLIPRPDTETLIDTILEVYQARQNQTLRVLDLGTGSGIIAITLALECPNWQVFAADISPPALAVAQSNAAQLNASVDFALSNWLDAFNGQTFDLILSNPPYIDVLDEHLNQGDVRFEPSIALTDGQNGLTNYAYLIDTVPDYLHHKGQLWFEHGYDQGQAIRELLEKHQYTAVRTIRDLAGNERVTGGIIE